MKLDPKSVNTRRFAQKFVNKRHLGRTNLLWLCNEVLHYQDVCEKIHGPIIDKLQTFKGWQAEELDEDGSIRGHPAVNLWKLEGPRERLFLDPRGFMKTTVITIAHTIQWIINYPNVRVLLSMATGDQVAIVVGEILSHFRFNEEFRFLYPEFCPPAKNAKDWGNMEGFTVPCRNKRLGPGEKRSGKEKTVTVCTVGKVIAGGHYEVIKNSDLVDKENVKTPAQIQTVVDHFRYMDPLLERSEIAPHIGWTDVEGTRYDHSDLYGFIIDGEEKLDKKDRGWQIHERDAEVEEGVSLWPERHPWSELKRMEHKLGPFIYSCQMRQKPIPSSSGLATKEQIKFAPRRELMSHLKRLHLTLDLAGMEVEKRSSGDFTAMTVSGFDNDGRLAIPFIYCGRPNTDEVIKIVFELVKQFPLISDIKMENAAHERVLRPFMMREQAKRGWLPPIVELKRDSRESKKHRIMALQPWFAGGYIRFAEEISCLTELQQQILRFSLTSTYHDDILDTLADALLSRDGDIDPGVMPDRPKHSEVAKGIMVLPNFLGFGDGGTALWSDGSGITSQHARWYHERTGM